MTDPQRLAEATLLACPWGDTAHHVRPTVVAVSGKSREQHCVTCDNCLSSGPIRETRADAIAAWNTRSSTTALEIGRAMERERCAGIADESAVRHKRDKESLDGLSMTRGQTRDRHFCMQTAAEGIAAAIRSTAPEIDVEVLVEKVARAICIADDVNPDFRSVGIGARMPEGKEYALWEARVVQARAVLATLTARQQEK